MGRCGCGGHSDHAGHGHHHSGGCGGHEHHAEHGHHHGCQCGCGGHGGFVRRYISHQEKLEELKRYKDDLEKELAGVTERIAELEE